ncbi:MAG: MotA/TolQ/ExbB proton channel family protein [Planctomycetaceae bacterium]
MSSKAFSDLRSGQVELSWARSDIEQLLMFRGSRFTRVNTLLSFLMAVVLTLAFHGVALAARGTLLNAKFIGQGLIPPSIVFLSSWCLAILFLKWRKLALQKRSVKLQVIPDHADFVLSPSNVDRVFDRMLELVDDPRQFMLFNRISVALSNLRNIGRVSDVDEILRSQAENDEAVSESSYVLLNGFLWAIPILGFIGTVLGLSVAIGEFGSVMSSSGSTDALLPALRNVTGGLGIAFDTTLEALVAALLIQMLVTFLRKSEQEFLDDCSEYCTRNIVNKLKLLPFHETSDSSQMS